LEPVIPSTSTEVITATESESVDAEEEPTVSAQVTESDVISVSPVVAPPIEELEYLIPIDEPAGQMSLDLAEPAVLPGRVIRPFTELEQPTRDPIESIQDLVKIDPIRQEQLDPVFVPGEDPQVLISGPELVSESSSEVPWLFVFGAISLALLGIGAWRFSGR